MGKKKNQISKRQFGLAKRRSLVADYYDGRRSCEQVRVILEEKHEIKVSADTIERDVKFLQKKFVEEGHLNIQSNLIRELRDLNQMERTCNEKLEGCSKPWQGARWMEERRKIKEHRARLLGLYAPDKRVSMEIKTEVSKEDRDEVLKAVVADIRADNLPSVQIPGSDDVIEIDNSDITIIEEIEKREVG